MQKRMPARGGSAFGGKQKAKKLLAFVAMLAMMALTMPAAAAPEDRGPMPAEDDFFWDVFAAMTTPDDYSGCVAALNTYITAHPEEFGEGNVNEVLSQMTEMCVQVGQMRTEMETSMTAEGVLTSLFDAGNTNWHAISGLYFQKSENGTPEGRISFSETIDFMSYRFFSFMNNFGELVQFNDGYISLNAAMVPNMINYGASLTMYGLDFDEVPDIYVSNGATMRKAIEGTDVSEISYNAHAGTLTFTPAHFSSFKVVEKGTSLSTMKIGYLSKRSVQYDAQKSTFQVKIKGRGLRGENVNCMLGFKGARHVSASANGRKMKCTFSMEDFSTTGYYPLTISVPGSGEVTRANAIQIK